MKNTLLYKTFLYRATFVLLCSLNLTMHGMELAPTIQTRQSIEAVDLEVGIQDNYLLPAELVKHIQAGDVVHLQQLFTIQSHHESALDKETIEKHKQLISALRYTQNALVVEQEHIAQKKCATCFKRYKPVILPAIIVACSIVNLTLSVLSYCQLQQTPSNIDIAALSINVAGSVLPGILYSGFETLKHARSGWLDAHQNIMIEQLKRSRVVLQLLHEAAVKNDGVTTNSNNKAI